ncbi:SDR family NAD(P)-dependent oxidoreductase [Rhizobiales bacterium]|uniref:SDR family NAD(P)-dependent oxidoreductase n=1 Tax=Hongsoonwoonella zoysiae TaxID=2821844 RepID=UPI001560BEED|nr:SDR family NAD(P)-dependent oxidoreductase [Hongsoonwoonella zoysiae]NRG18644.1 SDR family NAD(P)-dependent oxidoreductase [Hongsoonwoonella zoysiae]
MKTNPNRSVVIIGAGEGISGAFARRAAENGAKVLLAARNIDKLKDLASETGALTFQADAADPGDIDKLFDYADEKLGSVDVLLYNPSARVRGPLTELDRDQVLNAVRVSAWGGFVASQEAAKRMEAQGHGTILLTGATASVKGSPQSAAFAMGKFALRGLAQSMARELAPKNIHVAHFVIDGQVGITDDESRLHPDAIAETYWNVATQPRSAWTWELELRPFTETF